MLKLVQNGLARLGWEKKIFFYAGILSLLPVLAFTLGARPEPPPAPHHQPTNVDTLIPRGFVLVPIEVQNYEALDSILGKFGMVDLFQAGPSEGSPQRLVARNVKILRAPQNPNHFAILIAENEAPAILKTGGLFTVIVKRPAEIGTEFVKERPSTRRKIVYGGE